MTGIPNYLTLLRILVIPFIVLCFYIGTPVALWGATGLFFLACVTDYLDGYLARHWDQMTRLGRFLDPIADKLLVAATILLLAGFDRIRGLSLIPAIIILCREILVSGLREFLAETEVSVPVTYLAKWKTFLQMLSLGYLIAIPPSPHFFSFATLGLIALWVAAFLTLLTGYDYLRHGLKVLKEEG